MHSLKSSRVLKARGILVFSEPSDDSLVVQLARKRMYRKSDKFDEDDVAFLSHDLEIEITNTGYELINRQSLDIIILVRKKGGRA